MFKRIAIVALAMTLCALCACSGSSSGSAGAAGTSSGGTPATAGSTVAGQTSHSASTGKQVDGSGALSIPDQLCVFLDQELPKVATQTSRTRGQAQAAKDFKTWLTQDKDRKIKKSELDVISQSRCPKVRSRLLTTLNASDLAITLT